MDGMQLLDLFDRHKSVRVTKRLGQLLQDAAERMTVLTGRRFEPPFGPFRRSVRLAECGTIALGYAATFSRPSTFELFALDTEESVYFLPGLLPEDFCGLLRKLQVDGTDAVAILHAMCIQWEAVITAKSIPARVVGIDDAEELGIETSDALRQVIYKLGPKSTLWWQRVGGTLYSLTVLCDEMKPIVEATVHMSGVGRFSPSPLKKMQ